MDSRQLEGLFQHIESLTRAPSDAISARKFERQRLRAACTVYYIAFDGSSVRSVTGVTRDISRSGLGFLSQQGLPVHIEVRVVLTLPDAKTVDLTGVVVYSRMVRVGWHLVGVHFGDVQDERLVPYHKIGTIVDARPAGRGHPEPTGAF
jgi:hypothetical protein